MANNEKYVIWDPEEVFAGLKPEHQTPNAFFAIHRDYAGAVQHLHAYHLSKSNHPAEDAIWDANTHNDYVPEGDSDSYHSPNHIKYNKKYHGIDLETLKDIQANQVISSNKANKKDQDLMTSSELKK